MCESSIYNKISNYSYDLQGFVDAVEQIITPDMLVADTIGETNFHYLMAMALLCYYEGYKSYISKTQRKAIDLFIRNNVDNGLMVKFKRIDENAIPQYIKGLLINHLHGDISHIVEKLNLLEQLNPLFFAPINKETNGVHSL